MSDAGMNPPMDPFAAADGEQQIPSGQASPGPGAQLAAYRTERGWSVEHVASQLNLAPKQVHGIEKDDYQALPGAVVRGFVRAYAKLLKVDPAPLIAAMPGNAAVASAAATARRPVAASYSEPRFPEISDRSGLSGKQIAAIGAVILVAGGLWAAWQSGYLSSVSGSVRDGLAKLSSPAEPASAVSDVAAPGAQSSTTGTVVTEPVAPAAAMPPVDQVPNAVPQDGAAPGVAGAGTAVAGKDALVLKDAQALKDALVLKARQDSWIEVKGAGNRTLLARMVKAGETETVDVKEPLTVVIGNAAGVDATLRGTPLAVKTLKSGSVARLSVK
jgi:cytoskeleton protein RodZ